MNRRYSGSNMSPVCHNFVQNAWKKDFCSNCFKSREDHAKKENDSKSPVTLLSTRSVVKHIDPPPSILKLYSKKKVKRCVNFPEKVSSVIGFGGDGWSDDEEFEMSKDTDDMDPFPDTEEEKELHRLTKQNTDFNTVKENLLNDSKTESKKSYTSLMLGKVQTDSAGKKKTLLVSVTPFGQDSKPLSQNTLLKKSTSVSTTSETVSNTTKKSISVTSSTSKNGDFTTSSRYEMKEQTRETFSSEKSLLDEISETLEQNKITKKLMLQKPTVVDQKVKEQAEKKEVENKKSSIVRNCPIIKSQERPKLNTIIKSEFKFGRPTLENDSSLDSGISTISSNTVDNISLGEETRDYSETNSIKENDQNKSNVSNKPTLIENFRKGDGESDIKTSSFTIPSYPSKIIDMPPIIPKSPSPDVFSAEASRELAGEPDGRADPDDSSEAPALPSSPIPTILEPRPSFLHGILDAELLSKPAIPEKPKVPVKPSVIVQTQKKSLSNQTQQMVHHLQQTLTKHSVSNELEYCADYEKFKETTEVREKQLETIYAKPPLYKQDSDSNINKRKAPMPPSSPLPDDVSTNKYQRNVNISYKTDSPVQREMEKREKNPNQNKPSSDLSNSPEVQHTNESIPEPAPRRNLSLSHDNLLLEDKRKGKLKFSLKKFLRLGSSKEIEKKEYQAAILSKVNTKCEDIYDLVPKPKPRLVIIHPSDLNGSGVQVVNPNVVSGDLRRFSNDDVSYYNVPNIELEVTNPKITNKPPPPPRIFHEDKLTNTSQVKPVRPPPPKSAAVQKKQKSFTWTGAPGYAPKDNIYANLGEVRSAIAPRKPERTASMRDKDVPNHLPVRRNTADDADDSDDNTIDNKLIVQAKNEAIIHNYDDVYNSEKYEQGSVEDNHDSGKNSDSDYEYVNHARSSSPECDSSSNIEKSKKPSVCISYRKNSEEIEPNFTRSSSLPYCGSETESEIYSPCSFYSSEMDSSECNGDYGNEIKNTTSKLRTRKGRSVVHKNLEDNYGAVVIANHEALAQVFEQVQQSIIMQPALRALKACTNLRWDDFTTSKNQIVKSGKRIFIPAVWNSSSLGAVNVTLMLQAEQTASQIYSQQTIRPRTLSLNAVTEFCDLVPLEQISDGNKETVQATIAVLAPTQVDTLLSYGEYIHSTANIQDLSSDAIHEATFLMLQLVNGLKYLQARGIEEIPETLSSFIILRDGQLGTVLPGSTVNLQNIGNEPSSIHSPKTNCYGRLCVLQGLSEECSNSSEDSLKSLCECAIIALNILLPSEKLTTLLKDLLKNERAVSMNQVKSVLEFTLWGPSDVVQGVPVKERELTLQRWLDLERATVLHGLVRSRVNLNVYEQMHLMFLVTSSAKAMCDASHLIERAHITV